MRRTPRRLGLLRQIANHQVTVDLTADDWRMVLHPHAPDQWQDQVTVTARVAELEDAGWVTVDEDRALVEATEAGWEILAEEAT